jgi:hypothetical protein
MFEQNTLCRQTRAPHKTTTEVKWRLAQTRSLQFHSDI